VGYAAAAAERKSIQVEFLNTYIFIAPKVTILAEKKIAKLHHKLIKGEIYGKHWNTARAEIYRVFNEYFEYRRRPWFQLDKQADSSIVLCIS